MSPSYNPVYWLLCQLGGRSRTRDFSHFLSILAGKGWYRFKTNPSSSLRLQSEQLQARIAVLFLWPFSKSTVLRTILPLASIGTMNMSSSDHENGAKAIEKGASISMVPTSSRKLPSWAVTSHSNLKSKSQMPLPVRTKSTSNSTKNVSKSYGSAKIIDGFAQAKNENEKLTVDHLCIGNTDRTGSDDIPGGRRLPVSFMNDESVKDISGSEFGKNIQSIQGTDCKESGFEKLEVGLETSPADFESHGCYKDGSHFLPDTEKEPEISQHELWRNLPPSIEPPVSNACSKASMETAGVFPDQHRGHVCYQLNAENVPQSYSLLLTCHTMRNHSISLKPVSSASKETGGSSMGEDIGQATLEACEDLVLQVDGKSLSQQMPRRILPPSIQPAIVTSISRAFKQTEGKVKDGDTIHENVGTRRLLPSSLMQRGSINPSLVTGLSNTARQAGTTEENPVENNERLIFQAALQVSVSMQTPLLLLASVSMQMDLEQPKLEASLPEGLLSVPLLRHQRISLAWMLQKESASSHCSGGILADDQGLGKTVSTIALIQMQRPLQSKFLSGDFSVAETEAFHLEENGCHTRKHGTMKKENHKDIKLSTSCEDNPAAGTLVVCPASVLRQWAQEMDEKVADDSKLSVLLYHGSNRTDDPFELMKYDVVLTTYSIVSKEVPKLPFVTDDDGEHIHHGKYTTKKRKRTSNMAKKRRKSEKRRDRSSSRCNGGPLAMVCWFRVVLDEAQTIKNHRTQVARACCWLQAKRRWCLSGTPVQNAIDDLYSYFRFLKYDPYSVYGSFCSSIKLPISRDETSGYKKLQAVLKTVMLRRTKGDFLISVSDIIIYGLGTGTLIDGEPAIRLPPKTICLKRVYFTVEERNFYSKLEADSRSRFKASCVHILVIEYAAAGTVNQNYANILLLLLRLRQACDHPCLVKGYNQDYVGNLSSEKAGKLPREMQKNLLELLETSLTLCGICNTNKESALVKLPVHYNDLGSVSLTRSPQIARDQPEDAVVTLCGHVFCYQCLSEHLIGDANACPAADCGEQLADDAVFSRATLQSCFSDVLDSYSTNCSEVAEKFTAGQEIMYSSKIRAAMEILQSVCKNPSYTATYKGCKDAASFTERNSESIFEQEYSNDDNKIVTIQSELPDKAIVFSQWTGMLDLLEISLKQSSICYRRLDGSMSLVSRDRAVTDFNSDPEVTVMIMSLKAGNLGLNMVAACHIILLDPWWNPTTEDQAIDRAHRIGQTRPVMVSRLTIKDTVEDRILALQEEKRKMVSSAFGEDLSGRSATRLTVEDLRYLPQFPELNCQSLYPEEVPRAGNSLAVKKNLCLEFAISESTT
ncbi:hypothetical protein ACLOJK_014311 [Asimina triloba]